MKSIKEKAKENCIKYGSLGDIAYSEFVDGANYVLEQIESLTKYNRWYAQDLYNLIEKLKSNK